MPNFSERLRNREIPNTSPYTDLQLDFLQLLAEGADSDSMATTLNKRSINAESLKTNLIPRTTLKYPGCEADEPDGYLQYALVKGVQDGYIENHHGLEVKEELTPVEKAYIQLCSAGYTMRQTCKFLHLDYGTNTTLNQISKKLHISGLNPVIVKYTAIEMAKTERGRK